MFVKEIDGQIKPYTLLELRRDNPTVSFPKSPTPSSLRPWGVLECFEGEAPETSTAQVLEKNPQPTLQPDGTYLWGWTVRSKTQAELDDDLVAERERMICTPAQMRLSLLQSGLLPTVQGIADADPSAAIVWEYATQIVRNSPFIDALGGPNGFTPEQIDQLFRQAMVVET